jgi:hypothetical protein
LDEDDNDQDVSLATLLAQAPSFYNRLFDGAELNLNTTFPNTIGVATGDLATVTSDTLPITGISFSFTDGDASGLYDLDGNQLFYYADSQDENIVLLRRGDGDNAMSDGDIIAAIYLVEDADGTQLSEDVDVWIVQFEALDNPTTPNDDDQITLANLDLSVTTSIDFNFEGAPSGQNYFLAFDGTSGNATLLVTGLDPVDDTDSQNITSGDTVNSSQGGGPTTLGSNNQMINPGEGLIFTFTSGFESDYVVPNLDQNEADVEANIDYTGLIDTTAAYIQIAQTQPNNSTSSLTLSAFSLAAPETGTSYSEGLDSDPQVEILSVEVYRDGSPTTDGITVDLSGLTATITGLQAGDEIRYTTDGTHNRIVVEANEGARFDIGGVTIFQAADSTV